MKNKEILDYIYGNPYKKVRPGRSNIKKVMRLLGNPQDRLNFIHVAGTNGKGSTCAMLHSVLKEAGYKVGMFTSPHLVSPKERFIINGKQISDKDFSYVTSKVKKITDDNNIKLNIFEKITAIGFVYFEYKKCDVVVLEVGLGGRHDATNIILHSLVSVIMNIGLDHTDLLGDTVEKIAYEKAGIIKDYDDIVVYDNKNSIIKVFKDECKLRNTHLNVSSFKDIEIIKEGSLPQCFNYKNYKNIKISLLGKHQFKNAACVLEVIDVLKEKGYKISLKDIKKGLANTLWDARLSYLSKKPLFIMDGAHNPQCAKALKDSLPFIVKNKKVVILCGMLKDKNYKEVMNIMSKDYNDFVCVTPDSYRALEANDLADYLYSKKKNTYACKSIKEGILLALELAGKNGAVVAFGSLYLAGSIKEIFDKTYNKYSRFKKVS